VRLAAEIALSSGAQVAVFLIPAVALLSWAIEPLALSFRPIELVALAGSAIVVGTFVVDRKASRRDGAGLILLYVGVAVAFFIAGDR
jgi:Ca2+:H+ antiporter